MSKTEKFMVDRTNDSYSISSLEQIIKLWTKTYNRHGKPDWSHQN